MEDIDYEIAILGGKDGPLGLRYLLHEHHSNTPSILYYEKGNSNGAAMNSNKTVALNVMKRSIIDTGDSKSIDELLLAVEGCELAIEAFFDESSKAYKNAQRQNSIRVCSTKKEKDFLIERLKDRVVTVSPEKIEEVNEFLKKGYQTEISKDLVLGFTEKSWNVNAYNDELRERIKRSGGKIEGVDKVRIKCSDTYSVTLEIEDNGKKKEVKVRKVIVCRGIGNFESNDLEESKGDELRILSYFKSFIRTKPIFPSDLNSLFLAPQKASFTSEEANTYSVMSTDLSSQLPRNLNYQDVVNKEGEAAKRSMQKFINHFPSITPQMLQSGKMCSMIFDRQAFGVPPDISKYFNIIKTPSLTHANVEYANLSYYTAVERAFIKY